MIPGNRLATTNIFGLTLPPESRIVRDLVDYELGGVALNDASQGLQYQTWKCYYEDVNVMVSADAVPPTVLLARPRITALSLSFDQNMRPILAYEIDGDLWLWWWDTSINQRVETNFGPGRTPRLTLDDKRDARSAISDVIFAYIKGNSLCYRQQRDRFQIERVLKGGLHDGARLKNVSMSTKLRLQFELVV